MAVTKKVTTSKNKSTKIEAVKVDETGGIDIRMVLVDDLKPNEYNPNAMEMETFATLLDIVKAEGMVQPILVVEDPDTKGYKIVDGEHRWRAAKAAGFKEIAVVVAPYSEDHAKFRTISMNQIRGEYIPLKMAKLIVELQKKYSDEEIRRMTGIKEDEFKSLSALLDVPDINFNDSPTISPDATNPPIEVNILLMPEEYASYEEAMVQAFAIGKAKVVALVGDDVGEYDKAMKQAMGLAGAKLRNIGLATICRVFNSLPKEQKEEIFEGLTEE